MWDLARAQEATLFAGVLRITRCSRALPDRLQVPQCIPFSAGERYTFHRGHFCGRYRRGKASFSSWPANGSRPAPDVPSPAQDAVRGGYYAPKDGKLAIEDGEIVYTGPNVTMGYCRRLRLSAKHTARAAGHGRPRTARFRRLPENHGPEATFCEAFRRTHRARRP